MFLISSTHPCALTRREPPARSGSNQKRSVVVQEQSHGCRVARSTENPNENRDATAWAERGRISSIEEIDNRVDSVGAGATSVRFGSTPVDSSTHIMEFWVQSRVRASGARKSQECRCSEAIHRQLCQGADYGGFSACLRQRSRINCALEAAPRTRIEDFSTGPTKPSGSIMRV